MHIILWGDLGNGCALRGLYLTSVSLHPPAKQWLLVHPRFLLHLTPTGAPWLNTLETGCGLIPCQDLRWKQLLRRRRVGGQHTALQRDAGGGEAFLSTSSPCIRCCPQPGLHCPFLSEKVVKSRWARSSFSDVSDRLKKLQGGA